MGSVKSIVLEWRAPSFNTGSCANIMRDKYNPRFSSVICYMLLCEQFIYSKNFGAFGSSSAVLYVL